MRKCRAVILILPFLLLAAACGKDTENGESGNTARSGETHDADSIQEEATDSEQESNDMAEMEEDAAEMNQIYIKIGESTLTAVLEDNESAGALKELLADGPLTVTASNYGGFEKVCALGTELPRDDSQTTTQAGDICLYSGNQIVIFYGSNSWAYTRLGKVSDMEEAELERILSGEETQITLSLEPFR